jgi:hypothetical protein
LEEVTVSMTINAPAAIMLAFYAVAAEPRRISPQKLAGTIQTDILKEYIAQKEWCFPVDPAARLVTDMVEWCTREMPRWHPISISRYHIREAGSTAAQEPSGAHMTLVPRVVELLREQHIDQVLVTVGGTIPADDVQPLKQLGVAEVFTPGATTDSIIESIQGAASSPRRHIAG